MVQEKRRYLMVMKEKKICGFDLSRLIPYQTEKKKQVSWEYEQSFCFDFVKDLPLSFMHPFEFDSKIHVAGGFENFLGCPKHSKRIFQLDFDTEDLPLRDVTNDESMGSGAGIPILFSFEDTYLIRAYGDYYFLDFIGPAPFPCDNNFCALLSGKWESLPFAPWDFYVDLPYDVCWFIFFGKIYFRTVIENMPVVAYYFDIADSKWTCLDNEDDFYKSFYINIAGQNRFCSPATGVSFLPGLSEIGCCLSISCFCLEEKVVMHALLVNQAGLRLYQLIDGCFGFNEIEPAIRMNKAFLLDLGDSKICAMFIGFVEEQGGSRQFVCGVVFSLTLKQGLYIDPMAPTTKEQSFLDVTVLSKRVYFKDGDLGKWNDCFIFPGTKNKGISRKRKELSGHTEIWVAYKTTKRHAGPVAVPVAAEPTAVPETGKSTASPIVEVEVSSSSEEALRKVFVMGPLPSLVPAAVKSSAAIESAPALSLDSLALVHREFADFSSTHVAILSDYAAHFKDFLLDDTRPAGFRRICYTLFVSFHEILSAKPLGEVLMESRDVLLDLLRSLECLGFKGSCMEMLTRVCSKDVLVDSCGRRAQHEQKGEQLKKAAFAIEHRCKELESELAVTRLELRTAQSSIEAHVKEAAVIEQEFAVYAAPFSLEAAALFN